jgi:hypothetical protein
MIPSTLITIALAEYASRDDFQQIGKGSKIRHGLQWLFRAAVVGLACWLDDCTALRGAVGVPVLCRVPVAVERFAGEGLAVCGALVIGV